MWEHKVVYIDRKTDTWGRDEEIIERLQREGRAGWECFGIEERGLVVLNDGTARGRECYRTALWLKRLTPEGEEVRCWNEPGPRVPEDFLPKTGGESP